MVDQFVEGEVVPASLRNINALGSRACSHRPGGERCLMYTCSSRSGKKTTIFTWRCNVMNGADIDDAEVQIVFTA